MNAETAPDGKTQDTTADAWQKMAEEAEPFRGEKSNGPNNATKNERLHHMEIDTRCIRTIRGLLNAETLDPRQSFDTLEQYAKDRAERLGAHGKINLYLRYEKMVKINERTSSSRVIRYNPKTKDIYNQGKWGYTMRAYYNPQQDNTFIDFKATMNGDNKLPLEKQRKSLTGYEKDDAVIDFAYTCEHELTHDVQQQRLATKEISFDALRTARDYVVLKYLPAIKDGTHFYENAHNDFFIETEADDAADDFLAEIITPDSRVSSKIVNPSDPEEFQHSVSDVFSGRSQESRIGLGTVHALSTQETSLMIPRKEYSGTAEDIISDLCDDIISVYHKQLLSEYPALLLEYNADGSRRSRKDIESAMNSINRGSSVVFGNTKANPEYVRAAYRRLLKDSKKFSKETSPDEDGEYMEIIPTGKTKEQIEAEMSERKRMEEEAFQDRMNAYWRRERQAERERRAENERIARERQEAEAKRQRQIAEKREEIKHLYKQGADNGEQKEKQKEEQKGEEEEQEEGMEM